MATIPESLQKGYWEILEELLSYVPSDIDTSEGSIIRDLLSPVSIETASLLVELQEILKRGFVDTSYDEWLDLKAQEFGLERKQATKSIGSIKFTGESGTIIPAGTIVSTVADAVSEAIAFETTEEVTIGSDGTATASIQALEEGSKGNVKAGSITILENSISGVESVINEEATSGGSETESDDSLRARILEKAREYLTGGSIGDYKRWAKEVEGVGEVSVVPCKYGAGTVGIEVLDSNLEPANDELLKKVEEYISPRWAYDFEAENCSGENISVEDVAGDSNLSARLNGIGSFIKLEITLDRKGIWAVNCRLKTEGASLDNSARIVVLDKNGNIVKGDFLGIRLAEKVLSDGDIGTDWNNIELEFLYEEEPVCLKIERLGDSTVWVDSFEIKSCFARDDIESKIPVGVRLYVERPEIIYLDVYAVVRLKSGYTIDGVKERFEESLEEYLKSLIFKPDNDILYAKVGNLLLSVEGVKTYNGLLINGDTLDITLGSQRIAKVNSITLTI